MGGGGEDAGGGGSSGSTSRKLIPGACDSCHRKVCHLLAPYERVSYEDEQKIKCGDDRPCANCVASGISCVTHRKAKKRGPRTKEYIRSLSERLEGLESKIQQRQLGPPLAVSISGRQKRSHSAIDSSGPEDSVSPPPLRPPLSVPQTLATLSVPIDNTLLDAYFEHVYPFMPLIHRRYLFAPNGPPPPPFLLKAMYAAARVYSVLGTQDELGKEYYKEARDLVDQCMDSGSLWTIHGLLALVMYGGYVRSSPATGSYLAMAIRMAQNLRLYQEASSPTPEISHFPVRIQKEFKRRLWWFCYKCDKFSSASSGRPTCILESSIQIYLPAVENIWDEDNYQLTEYAFEEGTNMAVLSSEDSFCPGLQTQSVFNASLSLIKIYHKVRKFVREEEKQTHSANNASADAKRNFVALEASLSTWFESLPKFVQYAQEFHHVDLDSSNPPHWILAYFLILYYTCVLYLHKTRLGSSPSKTVTRSIASCEQAATAITRLTAIFLLRNPRFHYVHPSIVCYISEGALFWLSLFSLSPDPLKRAECARQYLILKRALQGLSHYPDAVACLVRLEENETAMGLGNMSRIGSSVSNDSVHLSPITVTSHVSDSPFFQQLPVDSLSTQSLASGNPLGGISALGLGAVSQISSPYSLPMAWTGIQPSLDTMNIIQPPPQLSTNLMSVPTNTDALLDFADPVSFLSTVATATTSLFADEADDTLRLFDEGNLFGP